jgi:hypothetical protein
MGAKFFAHAQTGHRAHPASCTMGTGSFPGVKRSKRGANLPPLVAPWSRKSRPIPLPSVGLRVCYGVPLRLPYREEFSSLSGLNVAYKLQSMKLYLLRRRKVDDTCCIATDGTAHSAMLSPSLKNSVSIELFLEY